MPDANELVALLKKAALDAVEASKPVNVYFGEVLSASPLKINVEQKMILGEKQLILSRNVTDFTTKQSRMERIVQKVHDPDFCTGGISH